MYSTYRGSSTTSDVPKGPLKEATVKAAKLFIESVRKKEAPERSFRHLGTANKSDVMNWTDDKGLDLLHHTVILNNAETAEYLLAHGFFQAPFEPETNQYVHLACLLGYRTVLNILLQHRPYDNKPSSKLSYSQSESDIKYGANGRRREVPPIDVAAEAGHLHCVKQILDQCVIKSFPEFAKYPYIALACTTGSILAVNLILKKDKPKMNDLNKATEVAVKAAMPQCLDLLLDEGVKPGAVFDKVNFYHILFTQSAITSFSTDGYRRLPEVTQVLVRHKHSVNSKSPPNTYPLYSLIRNSLCIHDFINTRHYMSCLRILLNAGADPNFDEVGNEKVLKMKGIISLHGRHAYSSAMHCLLDTVEFYSDYLESKALGVKFVVSMADILFQNNAKINAVGNIGHASGRMNGSVMHQFAKSSVSMGVDSDILKFLLRQGADPNSRVEGNFAINTYFDTLFTRLENEHLWRKESELMEEAKKMLELSLHMYRQSVKDVLSVFKDKHSKDKNKHVKPFIPIVIGALEARAQEVWPLKRLCRSLIWDLCKRNANVVHDLPTDIESRTYILPIL